MEIKHTTSGNAGLGSGKKAETSPGVATEKASSQQHTTESSTVTVTDSALKMLKIEETLAQMPSFDAQKVESIKQALSDGSYTINSDRIAAKLINFDQGLP